MSAKPLWEPDPHRDGERAIVDRAVLRAEAQEPCFWHVDLICPVGVWGGLVDTVEKAKRAAERCARRQMGHQAWRLALERVPVPPPTTEETEP